MNESGQVYTHIEKEINSSNNKLTDDLKDFFWRTYYWLNRREFEYKGETYRYFYHPYNKTWRNERAVEIPICRRILDEYNGKRILEVGNVLSHYFACRHTVVDKYERGKHIINADITEYQTAEKFDLIISISTIEHIGWDEVPKDPDKTWKAMEQMKKMLAPGGRIFITVPLGYNPDLKNAIDNKKINFSEITYLKRFSPEINVLLKKIASYNNFWKEASADEVKNASYDTPFPHANAILIGSLFNS